MAPTMDDTGLVMLACSLGFCRSSAASRVEPERGRPEMEWMRLSNGQRARRRGAVA